MPGSQAIYQTQPEVAEFTKRWYGLLSEIYRVSDVRQNYALIRWMNLLGSQADSLLQLFNAIATHTETGADGVKVMTSALTDARYAKPEWLPWLAQIYGVLLTPGMSDAERRDAIFYGTTGFTAGTRQSIANAVKTALTGTRLAEVSSHYLGDQWNVLIRTRSAETPDVAAVLQAVVTKRAKPAGIKLFHVTYSSTWDQTEAALPHWEDWEALTWTAIEEIGLTGYTPPAPPASPTTLADLITATNTLTTGANSGVY